ncbi:MAG: methyl-accepting chemotaxis sensory transducer [Mahella sp.]|nr:methyl-accepting chemotaxis sensory transducer [Mahella sp.]
MCLNNMKGTIVSTWISTLRELYGKDTVNAALERLDWDVNRIIAPLDDIADEQAKAIIEQVAHDVGKEPANVWRDLGRHNIYTFSKWFPSYFERSSLKGFLLMMDAVHAQLTKIIRGAKPPRLICTEITPDQVDMEYISKRGLFDYFLGLLEGSAAFFNEQLDYYRYSNFCYIMVISRVIYWAKGYIWDCYGGYRLHSFAYSDGPYETHRR